MIAENHIHWGSWIRTLQRWHLEKITASFLEACGPLTIVGAQLLYFSEPFLDWALPGEHLQAVAEMFENPKDVKDFTDLLREETFW